MIVFYIIFGIIAYSILGLLSVVIYKLFANWIDDTEYSEYAPYFWIALWWPIFLIVGIICLPYFICKKYLRL